MFLQLSAKVETFLNRFQTMLYCRKLMNVALTSKTPEPRAFALTIPRAFALTMIGRHGVCSRMYLCTFNSSLSKNALPLPPCFLVISVVSITLN